MCYVKCGLRFHSHQIISPLNFILFNIRGALTFLHVHTLHFDCMHNLLDSLKLKPGNGIKKIQFNQNTKLNQTENPWKIQSDADKVSNAKSNRI